MAVLVFERDREKGEKICEALKDRYLPTLLLYDKNGIGGLLRRFDAVIGVMASGILVRAVCPHIEDKWTDAPVVAVDSSLRCAVPLIGGHHGGNDLARLLSERLGLFPAITTATDSAGRPSLEETAKALGADIVNREASKPLNIIFLKRDLPIMRLKGPKIVIVDKDVAVLKSKGLVVGIGARRGVSSAEVLAALDSALEAVGRGRGDIGVIATAVIKKDEAGMNEAAKELGREIVYLSDDVLNAQAPVSESRAADLGLVGVAEPAVLALASNLILPKRAYGRVTVAIGE